MKRIASLDLMNRLAHLLFLGLMISCTGEGLKQEILPASISLNIKEVALREGGNVILSVAFTPENVTDQSLTWISSNPTIATVNDGIVVGVNPGETDIIVKSGNATDKCKVLVIETVDMGLSVRWATCNLGAARPELTGNYYAWGETVPRTPLLIDGEMDSRLYDNTTNPYKYYDYDQKEFTRYNEKDGKNDFVDYDYEDDAARAHYGGEWRCPTPEEVQELRDNCTLEVKVIDDIFGILFTSKINGKSIFFPITVYNLENQLVYSSGDEARFGYHQEYYLTTSIWTRNSYKTYYSALDLEIVDDIYYSYSQPFAFDSHASRRSELGLVRPVIK